MKNKWFLSKLSTICICGILFFSACRTSETVTHEKAGNLKAEKAFFHSVQNQSFLFQTLSARMQIHFKSGADKEVSSRGQLKIEKDNRLQISIQPFLGIEAFRIELTPDSIKIMDRLNKRFVKDSYNEARKDMQMDFNFYNLQAILTNQLFVPGKTNLSENDFLSFQWEQQESGYSLLTKDQKGLYYHFQADSNEKLYAVEIKDRSSESVFHWDYENFRLVNQKPFPMKLSGHLDMKNKMKYLFSLDFLRVDADIPIDMKFDIPSGYQQVSLTKILKFLEEL